MTILRSECPSTFSVEKVQFRGNVFEGFTLRLLTKGSALGTRWAIIAQTRGSASQSIIGGFAEEFISPLEATLW